MKTYLGRRTDDSLTSGAAGSQTRREIALPAAIFRGAKPLPAIGRDNKENA